MIVPINEKNFADNKRKLTQSLCRMVSRVVVLAESVEFAHALRRPESEYAPNEAEKERCRRPAVVVGLWHLLRIHLSILGRLLTDHAYLYIIFVVIVGMIAVATTVSLLNVSIASLHVSVASLDGGRVCLCYSCVIVVAVCVISSSASHPSAPLHVSITSLHVALAIAPLYVSIASLDVVALIGVVGTTSSSSGCR